MKSCWAEATYPSPPLSSSPTRHKKTGQISSIMMMLIFVPFYAVTLIMSDPHAFIVQIFTCFPHNGRITPYPAPIIVMLRKRVRVCCRTNP